MITEEDLQEAIAECQGVRNPSMNTCIKLAALYTVQNQLFGKPEAKATSNAAEYSYSAGDNVEYYSDTEFWKKARYKDVNELLPLIDELMNTLSIVNPRLYDAVLQKL